MNTEDRLKAFRRKKIISQIEHSIEAEELSGATAEDLKSLRELLLTLTIADASIDILEKAKTKYLEEYGDNESVIRLFDVALSLRS